MGSCPPCRSPQRLQFALAARGVALPGFLIEPLPHPYRLQLQLEGLKPGEPFPPLGHGHLDGFVEIGDFRQPPVGKALPDNAEGPDEEVPRP
ncbi:hypothetical protein N826_19230 [Skermanella aerolata KACC 11604]|nr:hypothetical protein N826_19230 [Skermanella aerolata KACC 11604]